MYPDISDLSEGLQAYLTDIRRPEAPIERFGECFDKVRGLEFLMFHLIYVMELENPGDGQRTIALDLNRPKENDMIEIATLNEFVYYYTGYPKPEDGPFSAEQIQKYGLNTKKLDSEWVSDIFSSGDLIWPDPDLTLLHTSLKSQAQDPNQEHVTKYDIYKVMLDRFDIFHSHYNSRRRVLLSKTQRDNVVDALENIINTWDFFETVGTALRKKLKMVSPEAYKIIKHLDGVYDAPEFSGFSPTYHNRLKQILCPDIFPEREVKFWFGKPDNGGLDMYYNLVMITRMLRHVVLKRRRIDKT